MSMIVNILENFLGKPHSHYEGKSQVQFDCPMCAIDKGLYNGDGRGNLSINYERGVFKCWSCWERNNMYGTLYTLIKKYGNKQHLKDFILIAPTLLKKKNNIINDVVIDVKLPISFKKFSESSEYDTNYNSALHYVKNRGLTKDILYKYDIGFTCEGKLSDRIVIPSYDINGELNYFIARSWHKWNKSKYINPEAGVESKSKDEIVFNEGKINWNSTVYLVEGVFDHIVTPNSIPLLGKFISDTLFHTLQQKSNSDIVIVLDGGKEERKDSMVLYNRLNTLNLYNRIKIIFIKNGMDLSDIYRKYSSKGILETLRSARRLKESHL